jgi:hypothetical protein
VEATKMMIPRRRQNKASGKIDSVRSSSGINSFGWHRSIIFNGSAYNLSQTGHKEDYLSVVVHFVTADWELEKRIIGFMLIDCSHSGVNIAERISLFLSEYDLITKVLSVTLDNASATDYLTPSLSSYVSSTLLHQRCACHIINLIVKSGLKRLKMYLEDFRIAIFSELF